MILLSALPVRGSSSTELFHAWFWGLGGGVGIDGRQVGKYLIGMFVGLTYFTKRIYKTVQNLICLFT